MYYFVFLKTTWLIGMCMKSLWLFMREKKLTNAIRCSLENFGAFDFEDKEAGDAVRHVQICPLYAISQIDALLKTFKWG